MRSIVTGSAARGSGGAIPIFTRLPVGLPVYVRVRGGTDVQWTRVIAVVMITVRPESAKRRLLASGKNYSSRSHCCYYCDMSKRKNPVDADVALVPQSTISCPKCGHRETETMPTEYCQFYYECKGCGTLLHPNQGDCCVYCSFGTTPCPPIQKARQKGNGSASCCEP